jgi:Glycosyl hydrolase family 1
MSIHDVVLGATIDGYAVEGGFDTERGPATSFGVAQSLGRIRPSVRSQGTFEHLDDLVARAAQLGCQELRLTLEWARLERRPGERDEASLAHYERALRAAAAASMSSVVVLCDAAWPSWLGQEPWLSAWAPVRFADHARWIASRLEGLARCVVTFRAPNAAAKEGWRTATRPPYRQRASADATSALDGMLVAHQRALEAIAEVAPSLGRAILFEVMPAYDDAELWRDVASGIADAGSLARRRRAWRQSVPRRGGVADGLAALLDARRPIDVAALRSTDGWASAPPFEWWLGGDDVELLATALQRAEGDVTTVELGAGGVGWDGQLAVAPPVLAALPGSVQTIHLHGLVASTGSLPGPVGLLEVDQHNGSWSLAAPDPGVVRRLAGGWRGGP